MMFPGWKRRKHSYKKISLCLLVFILRKISAERYNSSSHKSESINRIPWNLLLDPSYTSHKISPSTVSKNQVLFSPPNYGQSVVSSSSPHLWQRPQSTSPSSASFSHNMYYTPSPSSTSSTTDSTKYSIRIPNTNYDDLPSQDRTSSYYSKYHSNQPESSPSKVSQNFYGGYFSGNQHHKDPQNLRYEAHESNRVTFPDSVNYNSGYTTSEPYEKTPQTKKKKNNSSKNRGKNRKPEEYFNFDEDQDNFYQEYEDSYNYPYSESSSKDHRHSYIPQSSSSNDPPFGVLSSSSSNNILNKAKDLLKFGSNSKPTYSSSADHYPKYPPQKQYAEYDPPPSEQYSSYHPSYSSDGQDDDYYSKAEHFKDPSSLYYYPPDYYDGHGFGDGKYDGPPIAVAEKKKGSKIGPLAFALGLLPLGLLLASLVPTVVTIPVTTAVATGRKRKRRELEFVNPVLDTIDAYGVQSLEDPMCLQRIFCSVVIGGKQNKSSIIQKLYYKGATMLDEKWADYVGLKMLLRAVKREQCDLFPCQAKKNTRNLKTTTKFM